VPSHTNAFAGLFFAGSAFFIWGLSPIYWKALGSVPSFEVLMHRMVWSFVFLAPMVAAKGQWVEFRAAITQWRTLGMLTATTMIVGCNWFLFIWAINNDHVLQTSMGYYINPLVNVLLGVLFLKERLRPLQLTAVGIAAAGVIYLTVSYGAFPWVSVALALSFALYGLIRKVSPVGPLVGLTVETFLLSVPAALYLLHLEHAGRGAFGTLGPNITLLLMGASLMTGLPLLLFTKGTKLLNLSTIGFLQYIAPSCTFLLAVFVYREPLLKAQLVTFILIWTALSVYSTDALRYYRRRHLLVSEGERAS
jgi:chloramphenicol-sensitive protein RarD